MLLLFFWENVHSETRAKVCANWPMRKSWFERRSINIFSKLQAHAYTSLPTRALSIVTICLIERDQAGQRTNTHTYMCTNTQKRTNKNCLLCQQGEEEVSTPGSKPYQILSINHLSLWLSVAPKLLDFLQDSDSRDRNRKKKKKNKHTEASLSGEKHAKTSPLSDVVSPNAVLHYAKKALTALCMQFLSRRLISWVRACFRILEGGLHLLIKIHNVCGTALYTIYVDVWISVWFLFFSFSNSHCYQKHCCKDTQTQVHTLKAMMH